MAKGKGGLMLLLGDEGKGGEGDDLDDFDDDLEYEEEGEELGEDMPSAMFSAYAESALGSGDPERISAFREAIRTVIEEGG